MLDRRQFTSGSLSALLALQARKLFGEPAPLGVGEQFVLRNPIGNPFFNWPRTLLSYPVDSATSITPATHRLFCVETNATVAFQISQQAELLFFSDLPAGATRTFRLEQQPSPAVQMPVKILASGSIITIDTGAVQVRIPATQTINGEAPGPILGFSRGGRWTGASTLTVPGHAVASIETEQLESGPLRSTHRITYTFRGGAKYTATVQCCAGIDFIRLREDMELMPADVIGTFDFRWTRCDFAWRQSPNHPWPENFSKLPRANYNDYEWEPIAPVDMDTQFGVSPGVDPTTGKLPYSVRLFEPWGDVLAASFANFWGNTQPDAAAIFIDHPEQWEDHEYAIWHASERLAVEFLYQQNELHFVWKLGRGTRSTCVVFYDHARDVEAMDTLARYTRGVQYEGKKFSTGLFPTSYALNLQNWYGTLNLDKVKSWVLSYPATSSAPKGLFTTTPWKTSDEFFRATGQSDVVSQLALSGVRQNHGFGPNTNMEAVWVPGYEVFAAQLPPAQRQRVQASLLLLAYVFAGEDMMPTQRMLSGHPNFLADVKALPPAVSYLFPEHPLAETWAEEWEAYLRLNSRYHTRPAVAAWGARGGRWTEGLGTYVWAPLRPEVWTAYLLEKYDGHQRLNNPQLAAMGGWLVNALSAPFNGEGPVAMKLITAELKLNRSHWGVVRPGEGPRRIHVPLGAHSERRKPPRSMWYLGTALRNYSPLVAEHLMWAARPADEDMEPAADGADSYAMIYAGADNLGTNPHLTSAKYNGYGYMLRASVDTPQELSIQLVQIDDGPNYRWGNGFEGADGVIYFYAAGKAWSSNGREDVGDRIDQNTDFCSSFGVWKNGGFRGIGENVVNRPFYDLAVAQFAEIVPRKGPTSISSPEYVSRAILLAGDDYFVIHDKVFNPQIHHRFSWFVRKGDEFPQITQLSGFQTFRLDDAVTSVETETASGRWYDGTGDSLVHITHKQGIHAQAAPFGAYVNHSTGTDLVFATHIPYSFHDAQESFTGTSGIIRHRADAIELALFHGTTIAAAGFSFTTADSDLGISARIPESGTPYGRVSTLKPSKLTITAPEKLALYFNGRAAGTRTGDSIAVSIPPGTHSWELTATQPKPLPPAVDFTESRNSGATVYAIPVGAATAYSLEVSGDNARTWKEAAKSAEPIFKLASLTNGSKVHIRVVAHNSERQSDPGPEYPLYVTDKPPAAPDGLFVALSAGSAILTWGEVLGVSEYRLYRRKKGEASFRVVFKGRGLTWQDVDPAIVASAASPLSPTSRLAPAIEYYVTTFNGNGESRPSRTANSDPASWRNWDPSPGEPFRRTVERDEGPLPLDGFGRYYPVIPAEGESLASPNLPSVAEATYLPGCLAAGLNSRPFKTQT